MKNVVILGGGISGLLSAYLFANSGKYKVHLVEKSSSLGGLLKSFDYKVNGFFDYGPHNVLETGIKDLDDFFLSLLPQEEWQVAITLAGQLRPLTGLMYNKKVQHNTSSIDLRESKHIDEYISSFFKHLSSCPDNFEDTYKKDAYSYAIYLFGKKIADEVIVPAIMKIYGIHPKDLNTMVMFLTHFTRVVLFEEKIMKELLACKNISSRLSYTDLKKLPKEHFSSLRSLYPNSMQGGGISKIVDKLEEKLKELNVQIHLNSSISEIEIEDNKIKSLYINSEKYELEHFVSTINLFSLSNILKIDTSTYNFDKNPQTVITNILIDKKLDCGELSFIYSYDKGTSLFRLTNYINYCKGAVRNGLYPITIETIHFDEVDVEELEKKLLEELTSYKLLQEGTKVEFIKTELLPKGVGFPLFSQNNIRINNDLREKIKNLNIKNLMYVGILSEEGLFFQSDIVKDIYLRIKDRL